MNINRNTIATFSAAFLLLLAILACGSEATPEKVGEVEQATPAQAEGQEAASISDEDVESETPVQTEVAKTESPTTYQVGDIVSAGNMIVVILGWDAPVGDDFNQPDEGKKFAAVDLLLVNQGAEPESVSSLLQMSLKDDSGQKYDLDLMASVAAGESSPDGEISPGERIRGKVGFQVPQDATGLVFVFDADFFNTGKVFVELGPEPMSVEPPAELVGESAQQMFAVGDIVEMGDLTMVVLGWSSPPGDDFNRPEEGKKFVAVDILSVNGGSETTSMSSLLQVGLKDDTGQLYDIDLEASMAAGKASPEGELAPGERMRGTVGFQVPEGARGLVLVFDADVFGTGKVFVELGPEPVSVEPPSQVPGEQPMEIFGVGDVIQIGDLNLTVNQVTSPPGDDFNLPDEGNKFIVVDVSLENTGTEAEAISTLLQMSLKDATGQLYDIDLSASIAAEGSSPDGELAPGELIRGQVGFQAPVDAQGLIFVFDADVFGEGKVFVALPQP